MNRRMVAFGACVALAAVGAGVAFAADDKADDEKVMKAMQGTWTFESHLMGGEPLPAEKRKTKTITFEGDKFTVKDGDKVVQAGTHKVDTSKKPNAVDATVAEGEGKGTAMPGIFGLDGDAMRVCFDTAGKDRPDKFASPAKSTMALLVLKRVKQ